MQKAFRLKIAAQFVLHNFWLFSFYSNINLSMPKFSISAEASLGETLTEMGITDAFGDKADFSGISEEVKLKVSKVG